VSELGAYPANDLSHATQGSEFWWAWEPLLLPTGAYRGALGDRVP
jgi:hypothetical protein